MKKPLTVLGIIALSSLMLSACQGQTKENRSETVKIIKSKRSSKKKSSSKPSSKNSSSSIIASSSSKNKGNNHFTKENEEGYALTLSKVAADTTEGHATKYTFYDIDGNGTDELLTGNETSGKTYLAAIYYLKDGQTSTYMAQSYVASGGGRRDSAVIYTDGTVAYATWQAQSGRGTAYLYKLKADNSGFDTLQNEEFQLSTGQKVPTYAESRTELDISKLEWKTFETQTRSNSSGLDITAIQNGDYSSLAGTWQNGVGDTFTFDNSGLVMNGERVNLGTGSIKDGLLMTGANISGQPVSGFVIAFIPAGTITPNGIDGKPDGSDSSRDRLFAGQQPGYSNGKAFYYKVK